MGGGGGRGMGMRGGGFVSGDILSMDANSITIELRSPNGAAGQSGSKIVFYTDKTKVEKTVSGTNADLTVGKQVTITGTPNPDGSVNADSIQIRQTQNTAK
jgi:uncharacterized protein (DUF2345 family)